MTEPLDIDRLLANPEVRIIVTCGSGGVGKTTTAAAIGLRAAEAGRRTVVLTIDPAKRLAQSMGLTELDNAPRKIAAAKGDLFAMMLDMKRTFDEFVSAHTTPDRAEQVLANPFYQSLSSSFAGTQEYMAMEKLSQLAEQRTWDLIVVDTPPSRSALDFLDAPQRLGRFLDGRMIRLLTVPARAGGRVYLRAVTASFSVLARAMSRILGGELLGDVSSLVSALETMFGGFRERAERTYALLKTAGTAFVVIAAPEPDALREASFFIDRLSEDEMPLAGVVVNRVHEAAAPPKGLAPLTAARAQDAADRLADQPATSAGNLAEAALRVHAEIALLADHDQRMTRRFAAAHPNVPLTTVRALSTDVYDLATLRRIGGLLAAS